MTQEPSKNPRVPRAKSIAKAIILDSEFTISDWNNTGCKVHSSGIGPPGAEVSVTLILDSDSSTYRISTKAVVRWERSGFTGIEFTSMADDANLLTSFKLREALGLMDKNSNNQTDLETFIAKEDERAASIIDNIKTRQDTFLNLLRSRNTPISKSLLFSLGVLLGLSGIAFLANRSQYLYITGKVDGQELAINSNFKGSILHLNVSAKSRVEEGTPLLLAVDEVELRENEAEIEDLSQLNERYKQQYSLLPGTASYSEMNSLIAQLSHAKNSVERHQFLFEQGAATQELLEEKKDNYIALFHQIKAKENNRSIYQDLNSRYKERMSSASLPYNPTNVFSKETESTLIDRYQNGLRIITSPISGFVKSLPQPAGTPIRVGTTLAILSNTHQPSIKAYITPEQAETLTPNAPVDIIIKPLKKNLRGTLSSIDLTGGYEFKFSLDQKTQTFVDETYLLGDTPAEISVTINPNQDFDLSQYHGLKVKLTIKKSR